MEIKQFQRIYTLNNRLSGLLVELLFVGKHIHTALFQRMFPTQYPFFLVVFQDWLCLGFTRALHLLIAVSGLSFLCQIRGCPVR